MGTVAYMSPEQARGEITDARTDIFSFGTVLYQMAVGKLPFQGDTNAVVFDSILNREPVPLSDVNPSLPQELGRIISQALEKDRDLRFQSATEIKTALKRLKQPRPIWKICSRDSVEAFPRRASSPRTPDRRCWIPMCLEPRIHFCCNGWGARNHCFEHWSDTSFPSDWPWALTPTTSMNSLLTR